jgi:hypothetical protein
VQNKIQTAQTQMGYYSIAISNRYAWNAQVTT